MRKSTTIFLNKGEEVRLLYNAKKQKYFLITVKRTDCFSMQSSKGYQTLGSSAMTKLDEKVKVLVKSRYVLMYVDFPLSIVQDPLYIGHIGLVV